MSAPSRLVYRTIWRARTRTLLLSLSAAAFVFWLCRSLRGSVWFRILPVFVLCLSMLVLREGFRALTSWRKRYAKARLGPEIRRRFERTPGAAIIHSLKRSVRLRLWTAAFLLPLALVSFATMHWAGTGAVCVFLSLAVWSSAESLLWSRMLSNAVEILISESRAGLDGSTETVPQSRTL